MSGIPEQHKDSGIVSPGTKPEYFRQGYPENTSNFLTDVPVGWHRATRRYFDWVNTDSVRRARHSIVPLIDTTTDGPDRLQQFQRVAQEQRWLEGTGVRPEDSHFTIIIPIHNEKNFLQSMLETFTMSDIPPSVRMTTLLLTNGCTDNGRSEQIVRKFMSGIGEVETGLVSDLTTNALSDTQIDPTYEAVGRGSMQFIHLNTSLASLGDAQNTGSQFALGRDPIVMNVDANNFVEPDALINMYRRAHQGFIQKRGNVAFVTGVGKKDPSPIEYPLPPKMSEVEALQGVRLNDLFKYPQVSKRGLHGGLFAWNPEMLVEKFGGIPTIASQDWALNFKAFKEGMDIDVVMDANIWFIHPKTFQDRVLLYQRYARGLFQAADRYPEVADDIRGEFFLRPPEERRILLAAQLVKLNISLDALPSIEDMWNEVIERGRQEFEADRDNPTWEPVAGTK